MIEPLTVSVRARDPEVIGQVRRVAALARWRVHVEGAAGESPPSGAPRAQVRLMEADVSVPGAVGVVIESTEPGVPAPAERGGAGDGDSSVSARVHWLPSDGPSLMRAVRARARRPAGRMVGVVGVRGGLGCSTLAGQIARETARSRRRCALVDLDPMGGVDAVLGIERSAGPRWADLARPGETEGEAPADLPPESLASALPTWRGVGVLCSDSRRPPTPPAVRAVVRAVRHAYEVVVFDLARAGVADTWLLAGRASPQPSIDPVPAHATGPDSHAGFDPDPDPDFGLDVILVLAGNDVASASALVAAAPRYAGIDARLVVRARPGGAVTAAELSSLVGLPVLGTIGHDRQLRAAVERGMAPGDSQRGPSARGGRALARLLELA